MTDQIRLWEMKRELEILAQAETDKRYGTPPSERPISEHIRLGMVNLNKPPNPSSNEVASRVRKVLGVKHAGHGGTLEAKRPGRSNGYRRTPRSA